MSAYCELGNIHSLRKRLGAGLHLEVAERGGEEFATVGGWFLSFVELGQRLGELSLLEDKAVCRLVVAVPNRDLVAAAITLGISMHRFSIQDDVLADSDVLEQISAGTKLRLEWPTRVVVGRFVRSEQLIRGANVTLTIHLTVNGTPDVRSIKMVSSVRIAPESLPDGVYESPSHMTPIQLDWERQALPGAIVFGDSSFWKTQMELRVKADKFPGLVPESVVPLYEVCRMDQLTPVDRFPHFVNVFEKTTQFPEKGTSADNVMKGVSICILDGNSAIDALFDKRRLEPMLMLGLLETGAQSMQDQAIERVKSSTSHLSALKNVGETLGWRPPGRCELLGWNNEV